MLLISGLYIILPIPGFHHSNYTCSDHTPKEQVVHIVFLDRAQLLTQKLPKQGYVAPSHRYKMLRSSSQSDWPLQNIHFSMSMDLLLFTYIFLSSITAKTFTGLGMYIWVSRQVSYKKQELITLREHLSSPLFFVWSVCAHLLSFLCCPTICLYVLTSVL